MGVARKLKIDGSKADVIGDVGFMREDNRELARRNRLHCGLQIRPAFKNVVNTREPYSGLAALQWNGLVKQDGDLVRSQHMSYVSRIGSSIVIAKNGELSMRCIQLFQEFGAGFHTFRPTARNCAVIVQEGHRHKIAGQNNQIRLQPIREFNSFLDGRNGEVMFVMEVADLSNGEAVKSFGQPRKMQLKSRNLRVLRIAKTNRTGDSRARRAYTGGI